MNKEKFILSTDDLVNMLKTWKTPNTYDANYKHPPTKEGVYLIIRPFLEVGLAEILYVGRSNNLSQRYDKHEVLRVLTKVYGYLQFYFKETENSKQEENKLIKKYKTRFN